MQENLYRVLSRKVWSGQRMHYVHALPMLISPTI